MENLSSGLPWILMIVGVLGLGIAFVYGTMNWRERREESPPGPASAHGPASKAEERLPDPRATVDDRNAA